LTFQDRWEIAPLTRSPEASDFDRTRQEEHQVARSIREHEHHLRQAFEVAARAMQEGSHPFGCTLVSARGEVLMEQGNAYHPHHDMTGHAERVLATRASQAFRPPELLDATLYTSAEPCAMCAGAIYWAGIGTVVYGLSEERLREITGNHPENPTLDLPCRTVFAAGQRPVEVIGPLLEDEAAAMQTTFWTLR
jgi:tRNA(Arg) A34 adenosine deaminase TadA